MNFLIMKEDGYLPLMVEFLHGPTFPNLSYSPLPF